MNLNSWRHGNLYDKEKKNYIDREQQKENDYIPLCIGKRVQTWMVDCFNLSAYSNKLPSR